MLPAGAHLQNHEPGSFGTVLSAAVLLAGTAVGASAQNAGSAERRVEWYTATYFRYKTDKVEAARQFARDHFWPVDRIVRPELIVFDFQTGEWHQVACFPLEDGPGQLAQPEKGARWMAVLSERAGGQENARKLIGEWLEMIAHVESQIVRRPVLW